MGMDATWRNLATELDMPVQPLILVLGSASTSSRHCSGPRASFDSATALVDHIKSNAELAVAANNGQHPRAIVMGARGRCGNGAVDMCIAAGFPEESILKWGMAD